MTNRQASGGSPDNHITTQHTQRNSSLRWLLLFPIIVLVSLSAAMYRSSKIMPAVGNEAEHASSGKSNHTNSEESTRKKYRHNIKAYVKAETNDYDHARLGGISNLKIRVSNTTGYVLDKVQVKLTYIKANGDVWETHLEEYTAIKPDATVSHDIPDTKRGIRVDAEVVSVKSKAIGLK
jgi:hypothetical protein